MQTAPCTTTTSLATTRYWRPGRTRAHRVEEDYVRLMNHLAQRLALLGHGHAHDPAAHVNGAIALHGEVVCQASGKRQLGHYVARKPGGEGVRFPVRRVITGAVAVATRHAAAYGEEGERLAGEKLSGGARTQAAPVQHTPREELGGCSNGARVQSCRQRLAGGDDLRRQAAGPCDEPEQCEGQRESPRHVASPTRAAAAWGTEHAATRSNGGGRPGRAQRGARAVRPHIVVPSVLTPWG